MFPSDEIAAARTKFHLQRKSVSCFLPHFNSCSLATMVPVFLFSRLRMVTDCGHCKNPKRATRLMRCSSRSHPPGCSGKGKKSRIISQYLRAIISEASPAPYEVSDKTPRCCQTESGTVLFEEITFRLSFLPVQVILDNLHGISSPNVEHDYFTKTPEDAV